MRRLGLGLFLLCDFPISRMGERRWPDAWKLEGGARGPPMGVLGARQRFSSRRVRGGRGKSSRLVVDTDLTGSVSSFEDIGGLLTVVRGQDVTPTLKPALWFLRFESRGLRVGVSKGVTGGLSSLPQCQLYIQRVGDLGPSWSLRLELPLLEVGKGCGPNSDLICGSNVNRDGGWNLFCLDFDREEWRPSVSITC